MSDARGLAVQAVALRVLGDRVKERGDEVKTQLAETLDVGDRKTAALDDGTKVGSISYAAGKTTASVHDLTALAEWVQLHHPDEMVMNIRPAFLSKLLDDAKKDGAAVDHETGALIPGINVGTSQPYLSVRPEPANIGALVEAIRANRELVLDGETPS